MLPSILNNCLISADAADLIDDVSVVRRHDLAAIGPVCLEAVVFGRVVGAGDHDAAFEADADSAAADRGDDGAERAAEGMGVGLGQGVTNNAANVVFAQDRGIEAMPGAHGTRQPPPAGASGRPGICR